MQFGFVIPGGDVTDHVRMGREIEDAGWDAVFVADFVYGNDPWVSLAAIAATTERVRLGPLVTPVSRRRPWKLASETATLDRLSDGRAILCAGLGAPDTGFSEVGEVTDRKNRAELLDEGLELVERFWSGEPFNFSGRHYKVDWGSDWLFTPVQQPRVPVWVVGVWPHRKSLTRALRWDGLIASTMSAERRFTQPTPAEIAAIKAFVTENREAGSPFDIIIEGVTPGDNPEASRLIIEPLAEAGATWWIESMWSDPGGMEAARTRIKQGPPVSGERT